MLSVFLFICLPFSISPIYFFFHNKFFSSLESQCLQILYTSKTVEVSCVQEKHNAIISFGFFFPFSFFSITYSSVMHRKICFKYFSGTTAPRISKFGSKIGYDHLYRVWKKQHPHVYHSLICPFFFSNTIFCLRYLKERLHLEFWNFV